MLDAGTFTSALPDEAVQAARFGAGDGAAQQWDVVKGLLRRELGENDFRSWIQPVAFRACEGAVLSLSVPTRFTRDWVRGHYADRIQALWAQNAAPVARVDLVVAAPAPEERPEAPAAVPESAPAAGDLSSPLDPRFTFAHFVTGPANALAARAAQKMAGELSGPRPAVNPLYIHGGVGLGKTHLLQAVCAAARAQNPGACIAYMTAERFMHRFVQALRSKDTMAFKAACRGIGMLLVDDLQFVCGKEKTQDEFLSVLDALMSEGKPVAVAADRPPAALDGVDERLRSRLAGGLVVRIEAPDEALRLDILKSKRALLGRDIPDDVLAFLAAGITSGGRALEGALNRLVAQAELTARAITIAAAEDMLQDILRAPGRPVLVEDILKAVAAHYDLKVADLLSPRRARRVARPRQVAMHLSKALTTRSLPDIGRSFGGRDHTTILHGVRKVEALIAEDPAFAREVGELKSKIVTDF